MFGMWVCPLFVSFHSLRMHLAQGGVVVLWNLSNSQLLVKDPCSLNNIYTCTADTCHNDPCFPVFLWWANITPSHISLMNTFFRYQYIHSLTAQSYWPVSSLVSKQIYILSSGHYVFIAWFNAQVNLYFLYVFPLFSSSRETNHCISMNWQHWLIRWMSFFQNTHLF